MKNTWLRFGAAAAIAGGMLLAAQEVGSRPAQPAVQQPHQHGGGARMARYLNLTPAQEARANAEFQAVRQTAQPIRQHLKQVQIGTASPAWWRRAHGPLPESDPGAGSPGQRGVSGGAPNRATHPAALETGSLGDVPGGEGKRHRENRPTERLGSQPEGPDIGHAKRGARQNL